MKKKILIIEDDNDTLNLLEYIAGDMNFEVTASYGLLPVADVYALGPDLILLDHWVSNGYGGDLCLELKSDPNTKNIPVVMLSAHTNIDRIAKKSLANSYLEKPFDLDDLQTVIKKYM
jgi:DNA-binding response OmpR family regulator